MTWSLPDRFSSTVRGSSAALIAAMCINAFGAGLFYPFALLYYTRVTSLGVGTIGLVLTSATLITLAVSPLTGALVDRFGSRRLVVTSQGVEAIGFVTLLAVRSAPTLFVSALLITSATRMFYASFSTVIADLASGVDRDRWYGRVGVIQILAAGIGGAIASLLVASPGATGFRVMIIGNGVCLLISGVLLSRLPEPVRTITDEVTSGYRSIFRDRQFVRMVTANTLFVTCSMLPGIGLAVYAIDALTLPAWSLGIFGVYTTILVAGTQMRIIHRFAETSRIRLMVSGGVLWVIACLAFAGAVALEAGDAALIAWLLFAITLFSIAQMLYIPTARSLAATVAPAGMQGRYVAAFELSWGLAGALGPALYGVMFDIDPAAPWLAMAGIVAAGIVVLDARMRTGPGIHPVT